MAEKNKSGFHTVGDTDMEEYNRKIKEHRRKVLRRIVIVTAVILLVLTGLGLYMALRHYENYDIMSTAERSDTDATQFTEFQGNILKYSNDGAVYTTVNNDVIWNQSFEMQEPTVSICQKYVAFADSDGKEIYVMDDSGTQGKFKVTMPVIKMDVSAHGTVAVLMEDDGTSYLALYSKSGEQLAEGAIHVENGGTPLAIALSADGQKLAVSSMDIHDGSVKSTVSFYNFGAVGENKVDHIVASYSYADTVIPELTYIGSDHVLAFSDKGVYTFTGSTEPKEGPKKETDEEIKGVFYDESYFALIFAAGKDEAKRRVEVYNMKCSQQVTFETDFSFEEAQFLDNHEICLTSENACALYTLGGREKFYYEFENRLCAVTHVSGYRRYAFVMEGKTEQARLKLFDGKKTGDK